MHSEENARHYKSVAAGRGLRVEDLLERVGNRDAEALGSLYDIFAPRLMGLLKRILSPDPDAESVLKEVFLRLWDEARDIAQTNGSLAAWLVLTVRHAALQRLHAQGAVELHSGQIPHDQSRTKREKPASKSARSTRKEYKPKESRSTKGDIETLLFLAAIPQVWMPRPEDIALVDARMALLQRAFSQIPKPQQHALELAVFGGLTESEIADQLSEPLGKVQAALRAAFTFMRHRQRAVLGTWTAEI